MCGLGWARARGSRPAPRRAPLNQAGVLGGLVTGGDTAEAPCGQDPRAEPLQRRPPPKPGVPHPTPRFRSGPLPENRFSLQPPLVQAIFSRDVEEVRSLLSQKENINVLVS